MQRPTSIVLLMLTSVLAHSPLAYDDLTDKPSVEQNSGSAGQVIAAANWSRVTNTDNGVKRLLEASQQIDNLRRQGRILVF